MPGSSGLEIRVQDRATLTPSDLREWEELARRDGSGVFSGPAWQAAWLDAFGPHPEKIITARADGQMVAVLPVARVATDARGLYFRVLCPTAPGITDYQPFIVANGMVERVLPAVLEAAFESLRRTGVSWWPNIPADHPTCGAFRKYLDDQGSPYAMETEVAPGLRFAETYAATESQWPRSHRTDVRRLRKRLAEQGSVALWIPATLDQAEQFLDEFFEVHDAKWLAEGLPGRFRDPRQQAHFRAILSRLWTNGAHLSALTLDGKRISYHFGFLSQDWLLWYRPSYRLEYGRFGPSKVHIGFLIEHGLEAGWRGIDFLLGAEPYKLRWSNEQREVVSFHVGRSRLSPSYVWLSQGKPFLRKHLQASLFRARALYQKRFGPPPAAE